MGKGKKIVSPVVFQGGVSKNIGVVEAFKNYVIEQAQKEWDYKTS